jgi:short-subunit dehydrogenase
MNAEGKTIVVTGGGSGMGRELVLLLLEKGARVAAVDINEVTLQETAVLAGSHRERLSTHVANLADREVVLALPQAVIRAHGAVDGVINNAGIIQRFVRVNDLTFQDIERVIDVNFWGVVNVTKAFLPPLLERPEAHVVNISSMGGFLPVPGQTAYGASKAAVKLFTEGLHSELLPTHVHVTVVFPGAVATNITTNSGVAPMVGAASEASNFKMTTSADAARVIVAGMERNRYRVLVGSDARMMDFLCRLMPERAAKIIYTQMRSLLPA